jgi:hypothetical protein
MPLHRTVRAGPSVWEHAPVTTYPEPRILPGSLFVLAVLRPAWAYRVELAAIAALGVAYYWLSARYSGRTAEAVILAAAVLVAAVPFTRKGLAGVLHRSYLRRRWALACRHAALLNRNDHTPRIAKAGFVPSGDLLRVRMPAGRAVADLEKQAEPVAAFLEARELCASPARPATPATPVSWSCAATRWLTCQGCPGPTCAPPACRSGSRSRSA